MAKKTSTKMNAEAVDSSWSPSVHLDVKALSELEDLKVGDKVTVVIQGKVKSVEQRQDWDDSKKTRGSISLGDYVLKITGPSDFDDLMEDDDD